MTKKKDEGEKPEKDIWWKPKESEERREARRALNEERRRLKAEKARSDVFRSAIPVERGKAEIEEGYLRGPVVAGVRYSQADGTVERVYIPPPKNHITETIRIHELIHARISEPMDTMAEQITEDLYVHAKYWPKTIELTRSAVATARMHVKEISAQPPYNKASWNYGVADWARCMATCMNYFINKEKFTGTEGKSELTREGKALFQEIYKCSDGPSRVISGNVLNMLQALAQGIADGRITASPEHKRSVAARIEQLLFDEKKLGKGFPWLEEDYDPDDDWSPNTTWRGTHGTREGDWETLYIDLPKPLPTMKQGRKVVIASSGAHLVGSRLTKAILGQTKRFFKRRKMAPEPIGSIAVDASGSMGVSNEKLKRLCSCAPGAVVFYHSGDDDNSGGKGHICIWARNRRMADKVIHHYGGNGCDLEALEFLLKQRPPRYWVTDQGFCGGIPGKAEKAKELLEICLRDGRIAGVIPNISQALALWEPLMKTQST